MKKKKNNKMKKHRSKKSFLIGFPIGLFVLGVVLLSLAFFDGLKHAYYISQLFITQDVVVDASDLSTDSSSEQSENGNSFPQFGEKYAELKIESAGIVTPIYVGDSEEILLQGTGQYYGSVFPGETGNTVLVGHRNSVFKTLGEAEIGDEIIMETSYGNYTYEIIETKITTGTDQSILAPTDEATLTVYTCYPFDYIGHSPDRYSVIAKLVEGTPLSEIDF
ncbi:MAG: sortase [Carnobacterium sp.]|uniref:class D sortase n=1 Tax=Carnobacterium sp. TaxID=48221 RepID=UPI00264830E9|nr:class D sortase [Carnobacterium sp.]MDN5372953.1 sortase [Carnobacterium sp.]